MFHYSQFGFLQGLSTEKILLTIQDEVSKNFENKKFTIGVFLDIEKAFDTVNIPILLHKLGHYGIRGIVLDLIASYLTDRSIKTFCNDVLSRLEKINFGVPQCLY